LEKKGLFCRRLNDGQSQNALKRRLPGESLDR
jgi:hypothetical protein